MVRMLLFLKRESKATKSKLSPRSTQRSRRKKQTKSKR
ncbi:hypothetical protein SVI_0020 [Shewanella violacea DSS12]|uniref:Uncharacterized protein n=1 Tax=Shewanella violacea (strain JCM 10179 / CIP 106290 / LMG 19151 / DSS12) TaxID=637905 RepID=D4ZD69_SHEVD|nr:hypothetical protein SVI_0020 [Shewanella violacea DSS12]